MYHAEIDLPDNLANEVSINLKNTGKTFKQFIQQAVEHELEGQKKADLAGFLNTLKPLESFANIDTTAYVDELRNKSRLLNG
ncbi:MAG: hypothetical protein GQ569_02130 [Methylococcaceae bacterium]|nr:hypothetical protein [Methylococcaceae bacterium]